MYIYGVEKITGNQNFEGFEFDSFLFNMYFSQPYEINRAKLCQ